MKLVLLQNASGPYVPLLEATLDHHRRYCERHNILYLPTFGRASDRPSPNWDRFPLMIQLTNSPIVWLDADSVIVGNTDLREIFNGVNHVGMAKYPDSAWKDWGFHFNGGVMALRDTHQAFEFIHRVWTIGDTEGPAGWVNQTAIHLAQEQLKIVDPIGIFWNQPPWFSPVNPIGSGKPMIKSFHSHKAAALPFIQNELAQL